MIYLIILAFLGVGIFIIALAILLIIKTTYFAKGINKHPAFCDLLDYAYLYDNDTILLKNGAYLSIYELFVCDLLNQDESSINEAITHLQKTISTLDGALGLHIDLIRDSFDTFTPYTTSKHPLINELDAKRAKSFKEKPCFNNRLYLSLTHKNALGSKLKSSKRHKALHDSLKKEEDKDYKAFKENSKALINSLEIFCKVKALSFLDDEDFTSHEAVNYIFKCIYNENTKLALSKKAPYLDSYLSPYDISCDKYIAFNDSKTSVIAIEGLPCETYFGLLNDICNMPFALRFNVRFIAFDHMLSNIYLEKYRRMWSQKSKGFLSQITNTDNGRTNRYADENIDEIDDAKSSLMRGNTYFGTFSANILLQDKDLDTLSKNTKYLRQFFERRGFKTRIESINLFEAFLGTLPGHLSENLRRPIISHDVLCDILPLNKNFIGEIVSPNSSFKGMKSPLAQITSNGDNLFYLNLHDKDLANTLVLGPPGSGKSVLLGFLVLNLMRYKDMSIFVFEKGYSFYGLTKALGGRHIELNHKKALLCPLYNLETSNDFSKAKDFIYYLLKLSNLELQQDYKDDIDTALGLVATLDKKERSLSSFTTFINRREIVLALKPYLSNDNFISILDGNEDLAFNSNLITVEFDDIFEVSSIPATAIMRHLFNVIDSLRYKDNKPKAIIIDEAWLVLKDEYFATKLLSWFKTLRKDNIFVILATQSVDDLCKSKMLDTVLDCAKTRFYLPNSAALASPSSIESYKKLGLSDNNIKTIANAIAKREYFFCKNDKKALLTLRMSQTELDLISMSGSSIKETIDSKFEIYGSSFYEH